METSARIEEPYFLLKCKQVSTYSAVCAQRHLLFLVEMETSARIEKRNFLLKWKQVSTNSCLRA
jgi:hypothetical protein